MIVTSVSGHLLELDFEENARKWYAVPPVELFEAQIITKVPQVKLQFKHHSTRTKYEKKN